MEKTLAELKLLHNYQVKHRGPQAQILAVGLSSRKNLCVNSTVLAAENRDSVDAACRKLTASWVRNLAAENPNVPTCEFYEEYEKAGSGAVLPPGVYTLQDLRAYGKQRWCPYFLAWHMVQFSNVVVYSYQYMLDPKVAGIISKEMQKESVVVFDAAHNIDNVCIEALSASARRQTIEDRLRKEYNRLVDGLAQGGNLPSIYLASKSALPDDILKEAVPGNIRKADHFVHVLRRLVNHLEVRLERGGPDELLHIQTICNFATLVGTYTRGFSMIIEPFDERMRHIPDPVLQLCCHDASLAIKPVFDRFQSVVITSGTLSPIDLYPHLLNFHPVISRSFTMSLTRDCKCPMVLTRGSDQLPVSTKYDMRSDLGMVTNHGRLLLEMVSAVPDGVVCFFVSYSYMDMIVDSWNENGILKEIMQHKLVFIETQDVVETTLALDNYRAFAHGAIFFIRDYNLEQNEDNLEYLRDTFQIKEGDFLTFDALRQAAQCVGRIIRSKADYGMKIFADKRCSRHDKRSKLPGWILSHLPNYQSYTEEFGRVGHFVIGDLSIYLPEHGPGLRSKLSSNSISGFQD
ncbi:hypothetical protein C1H46_021563 [Malus baccata]|uniref:Helicase ATP-binding domain-containing protein n=1 Tax=Malus baccata TaxID=106549 RepID=A0A540M263_MALBA|nr:hypothetical protein C1H46_021563 [Malus baccata]